VAASANYDTGREGGHQLNLLAGLELKLNAQAEAESGWLLSLIKRMKSVM
jgi:hypothetical protein